MNYDAIVIGSGIGGLAFASLTAQLKGWRVLVLERHFKIGGFTHTFERPGGYEWDVGIHYVGQMKPGSTSRQIMDLVTGGHVQWQPMPGVYDRYVSKDFTFDFPRGRRNLRNALVARFPEETPAIDRYFRDVAKAASWSTRFAIADALPPAAGKLLRKFNLWTGRLGRTTTGAYLNANFRDPRLKSLLAMQWGDYGVPPAESAFATHALIASHYFDGGWYPQGGSARIAEGASAKIREAGGDLRVYQDVERIVIENGRAIGVDVRHSKGATQRILAPVIVSNAGAWTTFHKLAPGIVHDFGDWDGSGFAVATLYLGLKRDPRELGFQGENHWIFNEPDHDAAAARIDTAVLDGQALNGYLSFPSLKNPEAHTHTAEIITAMPYAAVERFRSAPWRRRGPEYEAIKATVSNAMLNLVEQYYPGFRDLVAYQELSTPLTSEHFTGHKGGAIYGYPATPQRFEKSFIGARTPVRGLFQAGTDALSHGVMGALMGGVTAAAIQMGPAGFPRIFKAAAQAAGKAGRGGEGVTFAAESGRPAADLADTVRPRQARPAGIE